MLDHWKVGQHNCCDYQRLYYNPPEEGKAGKLVSS
jgi:hypothetical protein